MYQYPNLINISMNKNDKIHKKVSIQLIKAMKMRHGLLYILTLCKILVDIST